MTHAWPTRAEWQADAESFTRTLCCPRQRVSDRADSWLNTDELAEVRAVAHRLAKTLRREITRAINALAPQFPDEPASVVDRYDYEDVLDEARRADFKCLTSARQDRLQLGRDARIFQGLSLTIAAAEAAGRRFARIGSDWGTSDTAADLERLDHLLGAMTERCDTAAHEATETAVQAEIAKRNSDEGWAKELKRRERLDQARNSPFFH
jgi:hypothetical protein